MTAQMQEFPDENRPFIESFEANEISPYAVAIQEFDNSQEQFLNTVAILFSQPFHASDSAVLTQSLNNVIERYRKCIEVVHENDSDTKTRIATIAHLTLEEDEKHINAFTAIAPESELSFVRYKREVVLENMEAIYNNADSDEEAMIGLLQAFGQALGNDTQNFFQLFRVQRTENTSEIQKPSPLRVIGKHALDVAKIGIGITAGIVAASFITKRH